MNAIGQNCHLQRLGSGRVVVTSANTGFWMVDGLYEGHAPFQVIRSVNQPDRVIVPQFSQTGTGTDFDVQPPPPPPQFPFQIYLVCKWTGIEFVGAVFPDVEVPFGPFYTTAFASLPSFSPPEQPPHSAIGVYTVDPPGPGPFASTDTQDDFQATNTDSGYYTSYELEEVSFYIGRSDLSGIPPLTAGTYQMTFDVSIDPAYSFPGSFTLQGSYTAGPFQMTGSEDVTDHSTWPTVAMGTVIDLISSSQFDTAHLRFSNVQFERV